MCGRLLIECLLVSFVNAGLMTLGQSIGVMTAASISGCAAAVSASCVVMGVKSSIVVPPLYCFMTPAPTCAGTATKLHS